MMDLLKALCEVPGVTGFEDEAQDLVTAELQAVCDRVWRDRLGNVIGLDVTGTADLGNTGSGLGIAQGATA